MTQETELLPCPFCGAPAFAHELEAHEHSTFLKALIPGMPNHSGSYVIEGSCECGSGLMADTREQVVMMWNRRAPDARDARIAELEAKLDAALAPVDHAYAAFVADLNGESPSTPATPWYPDDSGEWVEVPEDLVKMPAALEPKTFIETLNRYEREENDYFYAVGDADRRHWNEPVSSAARIVAYKVVKP